MKTTNTLIYKAILLIGILCLAQGAYASITLDSVVSTSSHCANDGSITIYASGSSSLLYAIDSGSVLIPAQGSNSFSALASGTYRIILTDFTNDTTIVRAVVGGSYIQPDFVPSWQDPICPGTSTGMITGAVNNASGIPPYSWQLTNTGTGATFTQTSDTFHNLPAGTYTLRLYDSCQGYATRYVTLVDPNLGFYANITNTIHNCDTDLMDIRIVPIVADGWSQPYTVYITTTTGSYTYTLNDPALNPTIAYDDYEITVPGISLGQLADMTIKNSCGLSLFVYNNVIQPAISMYFDPIQDTCQTSYRPIVYISGDDSVGNLTIIDWSQVTSIEWDTTTHTLFDSSSGGNGFSRILIPGHVYLAILTGPCGLDDSILYATPFIDTPSINVAHENFSCLDSTASLYLTAYNFSSVPTFTILSGPAIVSGSKPYFNHWDTITYPQTYSSFYSCTLGATCFEVGSLGVGTYTYEVYDNCGQIITGTVVITPSDVTDFKYQRSIVKGCPGQNKIIFDLVYPDAFTYPGYMRLKPEYAFRYTDSLLSADIYADSLIGVIDTFINLNSGTYVLDMVPLNYNGENGIITQLLSPGMSCDEVHDTVTIPPYQTPQISYSNQVICNGTMNVTLQPDSSRGVAPYQYQILSGPQTGPAQSSNSFALSSPGLYLVRISDTCGFASTFIFSVDTANSVGVIKTGSSCPGRTAILTSDQSVYYTYIWQRPNGTFYTGDSLPVGPVSTTDYGTYHIWRIVNVNGCIDTVRGTYRLDTNSVSYTSAGICPGQSYIFGGQPRTVAGSYSDTIHTTSCDSIAFLTLVNNGPVYTNSSQVLCGVQSVTIGAHIYTSSGIYIDTFPRVSGCDSIDQLNLTLLLQYNDTITMLTCNSQGVTIGQHTYSTTGIYHDTLQTDMGCDSIITLNLTAEFSHTGFAFYSLCTGDSVVVGDSVYYTSGVYYTIIPIPGHCDSTNYTILGVGPYKNGYVYLSTCTGQSITYNGHVFDSAGVYNVDTIFLSSSCDSIVTLVLSNNSYLIDSVSQSICGGQSVTVGNNTYNSTGIYRDTFTTSSCDSIHILNLQVLGYARDSVSQNICSGQSITVGNNTYSATGIYRDTFATAGCDSIHILNLQVRDYASDSVSQIICNGQSVMVGTHTYNTSGIYRDTFTTIGCDSIYILNLQVLDYASDSASQIICNGQSVMVGTHTYNTSGIYRDTFTTTGCDSIYILNLQVGGYTYDSVAQFICTGQSVTIGSHIYYTSGVYRDTFATVGCDSIYILNLTVGSSLLDSVAESICSGQSATVGNHTYSATGIYRDTFATNGCDSIHILNLQVSAAKYDTVNVGFCVGGSITIGGLIYSQPGLYSDTFAASPCDSIRTLRIVAFPNPIIHVSADSSSVDAGDTVQLNVNSTGQLTYIWTPDSLLNNIHIANPYAVITQSAWIVVQGSDTNDCSSSDSVYISVNGCKPAIYVPDAFTPNGDGINDRYQVFGRCVRLVRIMIFNRWGEKVWDADNINDSWDGTYKGQQQPPGVYVYWLSYVSDSVNGGMGKEKKGSITLIR